MDDQLQAGALRWKELIPAIHRFNYRAIAYADSSWLSFLPSGPVRAAVCSQSIGQRMLSEVVRRHYDLTPISEERFCTASWQLILLTPAELRRLVLYAGVVAFSDCIARIVQGSAVRAFQGMLGASLFDFAQKRARFLFQPRAELLNARERFPVSPTEAEAVIQRTGATYLSLMCSQLDGSKQVWRRVRMKLPSSWSSEQSENPSPGLGQGAEELFVRLARNELKVHV